MYITLKLSEAMYLHWIIIIIITTTTIISFFRQPFGGDGYE